MLLVVSRVAEPELVESAPLPLFIIVALPPAPPPVAAALTFASVTSEPSKVAEPVLIVAPFPPLPSCPPVVCVWPVKRAAAVGSGDAPVVALVSLPFK